MGVLAVTVDGVRLDALAWNIEDITRPWPGARAADTAVPGVDGVIASINDDLEASTVTYSMWVIGTDINGLIPQGDTSRAIVSDRLDQLSFLFGKRHGMLNVTEVVDTVGTTRQFLAKVTDTVDPKITAGSLGRFTVELSIPAGLKQDPTPSDWSQASVTSGSTYEVTTLQGSTGPVADAVVTVTGPATNPQVADFTTGAYVRLNAALPAGQVWRVNSATWATRYGVGLTFGSLDTAGADGHAITDSGGGTSRFLRLQPYLSSGLRRVSLTVSGSGFTSATAIGVRARRKYLQ